MNSFSFTLTGVVFILITLIFGLLAYGYSRIRKDNNVLKLLFIAFSILTLYALSGSVAAFLITKNSASVNSLLLINGTFTALGNAVLGYLFIMESFKKVSPWIGFSVVLIPFFIIIGMAFNSPPAPSLAIAGSVDWGLSSAISYLIAATYYLGIIPVLVLFWRRFSTTHNVDVKKHYFFLFLIFMFLLLTATTDFILEPLMGWATITSEIVIIISALVSMMIYLVFSELILKNIEKTFKNIIENLDELVFILDNNYAMLYANPVTESTLQLKANSKNKKSLFDLIHHDDKEKVKKAFSSVDQQENDKINFRLTSKHNETVWVSAKPNLIRIDTWEAGKDAFLLACHDETATHKMHQSLVKAKEEAEEGDKLKSVFLATMSHELRTPLNSVIGFSEMLQNIDEIDEARQYGNYIYNQGNHLMGIIESILDMTRLEGPQSKQKKQYFSVDELFEDVHPLAKTLLDHQNKKHIKLKYDPDQRNKRLVLHADKGKIMQVIINLMDNAIKFTEKGFVKYGFNVKDEEVEFFVMDTGIGIKEKNKEAVFERFRQLEFSDTRKYSGIGLGLAICRKIADILNGSIHFDSSYGEGSTFFFKLKGIISKNEVKTDELTTPLSYPNLTGKTIMVAEDDFNNYELLKHILRPTEVKVIRAKDGIEAIKMARKEEQIDLILMDIRLPEINGMETKKTISRFLPELPFVAMSAYSSPMDIKSYNQNGFAAFINKPVNANELIKIITDLLPLLQEDKT